MNIYSGIYKHRITSNERGTRDEKLLFQANLVEFCIRDILYKILRRKVARPQSRRVTATIAQIKLTTVNADWS